MNAPMIIRPETPADTRAIAEVTQAAFAALEISDHTEQYIVQALRAAGALTVSLVAERDGRVVGHIAFSPVTISDGTRGWYGLGPVSVLPGHQRQGIGARLIREGLAATASGCRRLLPGRPSGLLPALRLRAPERSRRRGRPARGVLRPAFRWPHPERHGHLPRGICGDRARGAVIVSRHGGVPGRGGSRRQLPMLAQDGECRAGWRGSASMAGPEQAAR